MQFDLTERCSAATTASLPTSLPGPLPIAVSAAFSPSKTCGLVRPVADRMLSS